MEKGSGILKKNEFLFPSKGLWLLWKMTRKNLVGTKEHLVILNLVSNFGESFQCCRKYEKLNKLIWEIFLTDAFKKSRLFKWFERFKSSHLKLKNRNTVFSLIFLLHMKKSAIFPVHGKLVLLPIFCISLIIPIFLPRSWQILLPRNSRFCSEFLASFTKFWFFWQEEQKILCRQIVLSVVIISIHWFSENETNEMFQTIQIFVKIKKWNDRIYC